jgi:ligand-binding sensor domain-containing protein
MFGFKYPVLYFFIVLFTGTHIVSAQKLKFEQLSTKEGLPGTEVYNLYQDKKGYVWAFTEYGIVKHNGIEFIPVCKNLPLNESAIYTITENLKGEIYFANSRANIYSIKNDSAFLIKGMEETSELILSRNEIMFDLFVDDASSIYFSTLHNSYKYSPVSRTLVDLTNYYSKKFTGVCFKKIQNQLFLIKLKPSDRTSYITVLDDMDNVIRKISYTQTIGERNIIRRDLKGYYFLTINSLTFLSNEGKLHKIDFNKSTINMEISPDQRIWVGVLSGGLYELTHDLRITNHYLEGITVSDILFDNQSGMWVSTIGSGAYYCKNIYDMYYEKTPELSDNISLIKNVNNKLFIGTSAGNVFMMERNGLRKADLKNYLSPVNDIIYNNGNYLVGTKHGIWGIDTNLIFIKQFDTYLNEGPHVNCYEFEKGEQDTIIFISGSSIFKYNSGKIVDQLFTKSKTRTILKRKKNDFFIGTNNGLFGYTFNTFNNPPHLSLLSGVKISQLKSDKEGNIWICTRGDGLYRLSPANKLIKYANTPSNIINDISFVNGRTVLLSTNKGLFINYTNDLNIQSNWIQILDNETLCAEQYNNDIYIGTKQGLISLSGKYLLKNDNSKFYLESILVYGKKINADSIHLKYFENDIYFNFDFLAYQFPDKKLYYQLFGNSSTKGVVKGTQIHLQNLSPGHYILIVHPLINLSNKRIFKIYFYIEPAFWQTNTFLVLVIGSFILLLLCSAAYIIYRIKKKGEHKAAMTAITALLAEYRLTALKAQINPHFISNSLSSIQQLILNNEIDRANQYIAKFSLLIRYVLKYSDKSAVRLKHEIEIIDLNIELEQLRFGHKFIFEKDIHPDVITADIYIPPLITQPFIENAIWHGLLPLKNIRIPKLLLKINLVSDTLVISIIDNGVGRKNIPDPKKEDRESRGVWLIESRMATLNTLYASSEAKINFTDLYNGNDSAGTRVDIIFPIAILDKLYDDKNKERYY